MAPSSANLSHTSVVGRQVDRTYDLITYAMLDTHGGLQHVDIGRASIVNGMSRPARANLQWITLPILQFRSQFWCNRPTK
jgi:hypothetical protein